MPAKLPGSKYWDIFQGGGKWYRLGTETYIKKWKQMNDGKIDNVVCILKLSKKTVV